MESRAHAAVVVLMVLSILVGCGEGTGPRGSVAVTIAAAPSPNPLKPGGNVVVTVTATPTTGLSVQYVILTVSGLVSARDSIPGTGAGSLTATRTYGVPETVSPGDLVFTATAHAGPAIGSASYKAVLTDSAPPLITKFSAQPDTAVSPGDSVTVTYWVADDFGVQRAVLSWVGADTGSQTFTPNTRFATRIVRVPVSLGPPAAPTMTFRLTVTDASGKQDSAVLAPIRVVDETPPVVTGTISPPASGVSYSPGAVLNVGVSGTDNVRLAWAGYRLAGAAGLFQDSTPVTALQAAVSFQRQITAGWAGSSSVRVFLRDTAGHLSETAAPGVLVLTSARAPDMRSLTLEAPIADLAVDEAHGLAYALLPDSSRIDVISLANATAVGSIALPVPPAYLDVNADGSLLAVTMPHRASLLLVANPATSPTLRYSNVLADSIDYGTLRWLNRVRFVSSGHAMVTVTFAGSGYGGGIYEYDPATGRSVPLSPVGSVEQNTQLAPAFDGSRMLALDAGSPALAKVLDVATDAFGPTVRIPADLQPLSISADYSGNLFLVRGQVFDGALQLVGGFAPGGYTVGLSSLGPAGFAAYAVGNGVEVVRLADSKGMVAIGLPAPATLLRPLSDGHSLLAASGATLSIVTLW